MTDTHIGRCFCGAVEVAAQGAPLEMGYCHCRDCQSYSGAPLVSYTLWHRDNVRVVEGAEHLASINKVGTTDRQFCTRCGGHILNDHPDLGICDMPAGMMTSIAFEPSVHLHYAEAVLPVRDGLPKLRDFPAEVGGSGERIAE